MRHGKNTDIASVARAILSDSGECPHILLGPVVWQPSDGKAARHWYFVIASSHRRMREGYCISIIDGARGRRKTAALRSALKAAIIGRNKPVVVHDFDDELEMARWAEAIWPGKQSTTIRTGLVAERTNVRH